MALSVHAQFFKSQAESKGERIRFTRREPGTACAGAYDPHSGHYDPKLDREYHAANPSAPVCVSGRIAAVETLEEVAAFVSQGLNEEQARTLPLGDFADDEMLYLGPADVYLKPVLGENTTTVITSEFPIGSGIFYRILMPDRYYFWGDPLYWFAKLQAEKEET